MNRGVFIGNLGKDAELRSTQAGQQVCVFSVAATSRYKDKAKTTWVRCDLWGKRAEALAQYLTKGLKVYIEGEIDIDTYGDKPSLKLVVSTIELLGTPGKNNGYSTAQAKTPLGVTSDPYQDDVPF